MAKKNQKNFSATLLFTVFLFIGFLFLTANKVYALEVHYPQLPNSSVTIGSTTQLPDYLLYMFNAGVFLGMIIVFISLAAAGAMYLLAPAKPDLQSAAKDRAMGAISGLLILVLAYLIVTTINPQLRFFRLDQLPQQTTPPPPPPPAGVYFYKDSSCPDNEKATANTTSIQDLGDLRNRVKGVKIVQGDSSYISILYNNPGLWGKCQYIDPNNANCQQVNPFASSVSVHEFDFHPENTNQSIKSGVWFFRKPCLINSGYNYNTDGLVDYCRENKGGWYFVDNATIKNGLNCGAGTNKCLFLLDLNDDNSYFNDVPEYEQDCTLYDDQGNCVRGHRQPPSLGGENISSIIINGQYLVLLLYFDPVNGSTVETIYSFCQEFSTSVDVNKIGPQQVKWENIRNNGGVVPNYAIIIPIKY